MVPPSSDRISRVPPYSSPNQIITRTGLSPTTARLSRRFRLYLIRHWPGPRSLAATNGVSVDVLSYGYLDVSVPRVRLCTLCIQIQIPGKPGGFPHSEILGSKPVCRLPGAYRRLPRPSSPPIAKASTICAYSLDHITPKSLRLHVFHNDTAYLEIQLTNFVSHL